MSFFQNKQIIIRETWESDVVKWYKWLNDPETTSLVNHGAFPNTYENQIKFRKDYLKAGSNKIIFSIVEKNKIENVVGTCSINLHDAYSRTGEISIILGDKKFRSGSNYLDITKWQIDHCFNNLNLQSIFAVPAEDNKVVLFCLERLGFKNNGIQRSRIYKNGKYLNRIYFDLLKKEWK